LNQRQCDVELASELGNRTSEVREFPDARRKRRFQRLQLVVALAGLLACHSEVTDTTKQTLPSCVDTELEEIYRFAGREIGALSASIGGCGDVLIALPDGGEELRLDGKRCARHVWPAGFQAGYFTSHAAGVLVTSSDARRVLNLSGDGPAEWLDLAAYPTQTQAYHVAQTACGERYAVLWANGAQVLLRIGAADEVLWERPGSYPDIVATCDGVYFISTLWKGEGLNANTLFLRRIDPAGELAAEATLLEDNCYQSARLLGAVAGGVAVATSPCSEGARDLVQIHAPTGALLWSKTLMNCDSWSDPPCKESIYTFVTSAFEWPAGHVAWLELVNGPCPHYDCPWQIELVSHKMDGSLVMRRTIAAADDSLAIPIGGALWLGYRDGIDSQLSRLGPCRSP